MIDYKKRAENMHRRAQMAEGRLARVMWWIDAGVNHRKAEMMQQSIWPATVPYYFLAEAKIEADRGKS